MKKKYLGLKQQFFLLSLCSGSLMASPCHAGPTIPGFIGNTADVLPSIPAATLPTGGTIVQGIDSIRELTASQMEITQNAPKAVIHWQTFNIGSGSSVNFNQQGNAGWAALNAIGDASPSQIHGKLTADGRIYLINQNGILFGPSAQVNIHSLTASSLNLIEGDFIQGYSTKNNSISTNSFTNPSGLPGGPVQNRGTITAANGGEVLLVGGSVLNSGTITTSQGIISLVAGNNVEIKTDTSSLYPTITTTGDTAEVTNNAASDGEPALLQVESGRIGLYGGIVNQLGRTIATTAVSRSGRIELKGSTRVTTGVNSLTATPVSTSTDRQVPSESSTPAGSIIVQSNELIHQGAISSPGGQFIVNSTTTPADRIQLKPGSSIDVSGTWIDQEASDRILEIQLNSDALKDAYALKNGPLQGEWISIDILNGMPAADISAYLLNRPRSAAEQLINGGTIELNAKNVELAPESRVVFSGGGYNFSPGLLEFTKVRAGNKIYELSELPAGTPVDEVLGSFTRSHDRYGRSQTWIGSYYGGSMPLAESSPAFRWGGDAGTLSINAAYLYMAGILEGKALRGIYQIDTEDRLYDNGNILALGRRMPTGGSLLFGSTDSAINDTTASATNSFPTTYAISITTEPTVPDASVSSRKLSCIPASIINNAGLSTLNLGARTTFNIEEGVDLQLVPGGYFSASARQVTVNGSIQTAGGSITLVTASNRSSFSSIAGKENTEYIPLTESLTIAGTSFLNAAGEEIINTGLQDQRSGFTNGGTITLMNKSASQDGSIVMKNPDHGYNLTVAKGALLSVQGGYRTNSTGTTNNGDAGSIIIRQRINEANTGYLPEALALTIDGELLGSAFLGGNGGSLTIDACRMAVIPANSTPFSANGFLDIPGSFILADNRFSRTGFSTINLNAYDDLTIASGSLLQPSLLHLVKSDSLLATSSSQMTALPIEAGDTAINLSTVRGDVIVENGSSIEVAPEGEIELSAGALASISGNLEAPGGTVKITGQNITAMGTAKISTAGVNLLNNDTIGPWDDASWQVLNGGTVSFNAATGSLTLEAGSQIDVSGSDVVINTVEDSLGNLVHRSEAGSPGSIELSFLDNLTMSGTFIADSSLPGLAGGTLNITRSNDSQSFAVDKALAEALQIEGFDDLQLGSSYGIEFNESLSLVSNRRFVLNTPRIFGTEGAISVEAPWVQLINKQGQYVLKTSITSKTTSPTLTINARSLDIEGNIQVSGFSTTSLNAENAIRLSDVYYNDMSKPMFSGKLETAGNMTLHAQVIYPTTGSIFTVKGSELVSILPQEEQYTSPVYSAGASLTITGKDIYHAGYLAAPMGNLTLQADSGRILLAPDSRLSVSGETEITYGMVVNSIWKGPDHTTDNSTTPTKNMTVPEPSITVSGHEVIVSEGSLIEADGGGTLTAREFLASYDGTVNPLDLKKKNRLIIVPDSGIVHPNLGQISIDGYSPLGLAAGVYSILPAEYAFLPGAIILERTSKEAFSGQGIFNLLDQPIVAGYETAYGSKAVPTAMTGYVVRSAADVLKEGTFDTRVQKMADGGNITVDGDTALILGAVTASGAEGGKNGGLTIIGKNITYGTVPTISEMIGDNVYFDNRLINSETKLGRLTLGNYDADNGTGTTNTVTFADGMIFSGIPLVEIKAKDSIEIGEGAEIHALAKDTEEGKISLSTKKLTTKTDSLLHASNELAFNIIGTWDFEGNWQVDDGRIRLFSDLISIGSNPAPNLPGVDNGMFMTQAMLNAFTHVGELLIDSDTDIRFLDSINLTTGGSLLLDCQQLLYSSSLESESKVTINADNLRLENSKSSLGTSDPKLTEDLNHDLNLIAQSSFILGPGSVRIDGFSKVNFTTNGDMLFEGEGELQAMLPDTGLLSMTAAGFFAAYPDINEDEILGANTYAISSPGGDISLNKTSVTSTTGIPGSFSVTGNSVTLDGALLDFPGGRVELTATGTGTDDNITIKKGAAILAQGGIRRYDLILPDETAIMNFQLAAGEVLLSAASGGIVFGDEDDVAGANIVDVSAADGMDGGWFTINAPSASLDFSRASLRGSGGEGGSFELTTQTLPELGDLAQILTTGGFTSDVRVQVREGNVNLAADKTLAARAIFLAADGKNDPGTQGNITIKGTISASGETGGDITIYAKRDLTLAEGGLIEAKGVTGDGGKVILGSESEFIKTEASSTIDVTGASGTGGTVIYRVDATNDGAKLNAADVVTGADEKRLQAVKSFNNFGISIDDNETSELETASYEIITALAANSNYSTYTLIPELEITSTGDLSLPSALTLTGLEEWRPGRLPDDDPQKNTDDLPGVLTFRAAGNLKVETSITDTPTAPNLYGIRDIQSDGKIDSWSLNFVAGADFTAADPTYVQAAKDLTIGKSTGTNDVVVFTESGDINLIAGRNIVIKPASTTSNDYMPGVTTYTVATYDGDIASNSYQDLDLRKGGVLQSAIGNIHIDVAGDLLLANITDSNINSGAIRTTGRMPTWEESGNKEDMEELFPDDPDALDYYRAEQFWLYRNGGDITAKVYGNVTGIIAEGTTLKGSGWENAYLNPTPQALPNGYNYLDSYRWSANYGPSFINPTLGGEITTATHGIITMGGGDVLVSTGGDFIAQTGTFSTISPGELSIITKGELDGRFIAMTDRAFLSTLGNFGSSTHGISLQDIQTVVSIGDTALTVQALGSIEIGSICNPTIANAFSTDYSQKQLISQLTYTTNSSAQLTAILGDTILSGTNAFTTNSTGLGMYNVLPGTLNIDAGQDILFTTENTFVMAPAVLGNLSLLAGQDIMGTLFKMSTPENNRFTSLIMSDASPDVYNTLTNQTDTLVTQLKNGHSDKALHAGDQEPVRIKAARNISNINTTLVKQTEIVAGHDISNIIYSGQHFLVDDYSMIMANNNIDQSDIVNLVKPNKDYPFRGISQAGPGSLLLLAGNNLDFADSNGVQTTGNTTNSTLQDSTIPLSDNGRVKGSDITIITGYSVRPTTKETIEFLTKLKIEIKKVTDFIAGGNDSEAARLKETIRKELFTPFLYNYRSGTGDLNMISSSISTLSGEDSINIFAAGDINVGVTRIETETADKNAKETGIYTASGGTITVLAEDNINVNESRIMTFLSSDMVIVSDRGNINAGRGSKAKVTASSGSIIEDNNGMRMYIFTPPAVGSGLRTLAYDPDGSGPKVTPEPGDMYVVAWDGVVDAGEAGIEGGNLYLAATKVLNSQNISVGAGSVGLPAASGAVASLGALTGDSMSATESTSSDIAKSTTGAGEQMAETAKKIADTISQLRFFVVKFLGFME